MAATRRAGVGPGSRTAAPGAAKLPRQAEKDWQATVLAYARLMGWRVWHDVATNTPRRCGSCGAVRQTPRNVAGWPDLVLIRRPDIVFAELKRDGEHPSPEQQAWIDELRACGMRVYVWTPAAWAEVEEVLR